MKYIVVVFVFNVQATIFSMIIDKKERQSKNLGIYLKNCTPFDYFVSADGTQKNICKSNDILFIPITKKLNFFYQKVEGHKRSAGYLISGLKPVAKEQLFCWHKCKDIKITSGYYYLQQRENIFYSIEPVIDEIPTLYWLAMHAIPADTLEKIPTVFPKLRGEQQL